MIKQAAFCVKGGKQEWQAECGRNFPHTCRKKKNQKGKFNIQRERIDRFFPMGFPEKQKRFDYPAAWKLVQEGEKVQGRLNRGLPCINGTRIFRVKDKLE